LGAVVIPKKLADQVPECAHCSNVCTKEVFKIEHQVIGLKKKSILRFCSAECMVEHFEIHERVEDRVEFRVRKEINELHKRVCPACVRRFAELR
jgi:hypothetical protein